MSEITSRPKVRAISVTCLPATSDGLAPAVVARAAIRELIDTVDRHLAAQVDALPRADVAASQASALPAAQQRQLAAERAILTSTAGHLSPLTAMKLSVVSGIEAGGFVATTAAIREPLAKVMTATTVAAAEHARGLLLDRLSTSHLDAIISAATAACSASSLALSFDRISVEAPRAGQTRVVATDHSGRALVSEITVVGREVQVETEVVGVRDGSCHRLLDQFDAQLEARGVVGDRARRTTGGFCQLVAAQALFEPLTKPRGDGRYGGDRAAARHRADAKPAAKKQGTR